MISTVLAHASPKEHHAFQDISASVGISVIIIFVIFFGLIYRDKK